ncbi:MAG: hypothetical protein ACM3Q4_12010 [Acidobacteriota bacterium]
MNNETGTRQALRRSLATVLMLCCILPAARLSAQEVSVKATVDSTSIDLGSWLHLSLEARHPASVQASWQALKDSIGPFEIVQADTAVKKEESNGMVTETRSLIISRYEPGRATLPPIALAYRKPNDTTSYSVETNPIPIDVRGVAVDTTLAIKDIKPPLSVPITLLEILMYAGIVLALAAVGYFIYWYWKKKQKKALGIVEVKPAIPPDVLALAQLHELEERQIWQKGEIKRFYSEATEIIRRYFEGRYGVMALEMTTDEVLDQLVKFKLSREMTDEIRAFLADADMVKFAKVIPSLSDNERVIPAATEIIAKTRPAHLDVPAVEVVDDGTAPQAEGGATHG